MLDVNGGYMTLKSQHKREGILSMWMDDKVFTMQVQRDRSALNSVLDTHNNKDIKSLGRKRTECLWKISC